MSTKKYRIRLTTDEQQELNALVSRGRAAAYKQTHARILLMSDESRSDGGMKDADITSALGVGQSTVERIRKRCVEEGVESALNRKKQLRRRQKRLDGEGEARLIAMACGEPPEGRASWTLKLLADQLVECEIVGTISTETVRQALKKKRTEAVAEAELVHPARSERGVCVRDGRRMEDVLEVYQRPYDGNEVLVCMDETSKQQVKETRVPRPAAPGLSAAYDYEYERNGVSSLFMLFAPLDGWRRVEVRERRTKVDWAHVIKKLVDEDYPDRDRIVLVMDNLNTHKLSSLYEAFEPAEARRIAERLEIHYTPKHGSWLNMAEIEIGVLARQCLDRRIANQDILRGEVNAWQNQRNRDVIRVDWRFTTEDARIKLKSLYPSIQKR